MDKKNKGKKVSKGAEVSQGGEHLDGIKEGYRWLGFWKDCKGSQGEEYLGRGQDWH